MELTFAEVVETVEALSVEEKETLVDIKQSEKEFEQGLCKPMSVEEFMKEVLS